LEPFPSRFPIESVEDLFESLSGADLSLSYKWKPGTFWTCSLTFISDRDDVTWGKPTGRDPPHSWQSS